MSINDFAERNIRLIQYFVSGYKAESMTQNLLLVAINDRKCLKKELPKSQLSKSQLSNIKKSVFSQNVENSINKEFFKFYM